jgi:flagella basal body P-ring formation protein FlgA
MDTRLTCPDPSAALVPMRRPPVLSLLQALCLCGAFGLLAPPASGQESDFAARARLLVDQQLQATGADVEITVGELDARLTLAPCRRIEPFLPAGTRLWGRASVGVRCVDGANWSVYVPVQVKVFGAAYVAARPLARGQAVGADDVRIDRVELTQWPQGVFAATEPIDGRIATRAVSAGEPLHKDLLRAPPAFQPGDHVRVVYGGTGFAVVTEGKALTPATDGQSAQVALTTGQVVSGVARNGRTLEIK